VCKSREKAWFPRVFRLKELHKNENLLFKDFQDFLSRKQRIPENRLPYYLRWVSRYHDFCSRQNIDGDLGDAIAAYLHDLAKHYEDWQVQQAREAVRKAAYWKKERMAASEGQPLSPVRPSWHTTTRIR